MKKFLLLTLSCLGILLTGCTKENPDTIDAEEETVDPYGFGDLEKSILQVLSGTYVYEYTNAKNVRCTNTITFSPYTRWELKYVSWLTDENGDPTSLPFMGDLQFVATETKTNESYFYFGGTDTLMAFRRSTGTTFNPLLFKTWSYNVERENTLTLTDDDDNTYVYIRQ